MQLLRAAAAVSAAGRAFTRRSAPLAAGGAPSGARAMTAAATSSSPPVLACNVYISEGRDSALLATLKAAAGPACVHVFVDAPYNRTGFTLASARPDAVLTSPRRAQLHAGVVGLARAALARLDLRTHATSHPRLGVVDHVSVHALPPGGGASRAAPPEAHDAAAALALRLGGALASPPAPLPVYYYGAASREGRGLAEVRRALGYFGANGGVSTAAAGFAPSPGAPPPDAGPERGTEAAGVVCVGALPWVVNYNLLLVPSTPGSMDDAALAAAAKRVALATSARRGGPPGAQALALRHARGFEVACNLHAPFPADGPGAPAAVRAAVEAAAAREGLRVAEAYATNVDPALLTSRAIEADKLA